MGVLGHLQGKIEYLSVSKLYKKLCMAFGVIHISRQKKNSETKCKSLTATKNCSRHEALKLQTPNRFSQELKTVETKIQWCIPEV